MIACAHRETKKHGKDRHGNQRFRCKRCGKTFTPHKPKPLGDLRIDREKAELALQLLLEGNSIRSTERITGVNRTTLCRLLALIGQRCKRLLRDKIQEVPVKNVQVDECWGYCYAKQKTKKRKGFGDETGDCYTFYAFERYSKLVLAFHVGKHDFQSADRLLFDLERATIGRFQLTSDAFTAFKRAVFRHLRYTTDYATLIKLFDKDSERKTAEARYSPGKITSIRKKTLIGNPDKALISTSHIERQNLNLRMGIRRLTRLTNAFSKKWENHEAAVALYFAHWNFCRVHSVHEMTPAMAENLEAEPWDIKRLIDELAAY